MGRGATSLFFCHRSLRMFMCLLNSQLLLAGIAILTHAPVPQTLEFMMGLSRQQFTSWPQSARHWQLLKPLGNLLGAPRAAGVSTREDLQGCMVQSSQPLSCAPPPDAAICVRPICNEMHRSTHDRPQGWLGYPLAHAKEERHGVDIPSTCLLRAHMCCGRDASPGWEQKTNPRMKSNQWK